MHNSIRSAFSYHGLDIDVETAMRFHNFYNLIINANNRTNLTAITDFDKVLLKHFIDSCSPAMIGLLDGCCTCIDVGSGAGFPGIPLALIYTNCHFTLIDSTRKKVQFIEHAIQALNLKNCTALQARAETLGRKDEYRECFDIAVSRAVTDLPALCEYCLPLVKVGGCLIAYRGSAQAVEVGPMEGLGATGIEIIQVPVKALDHYLVIVKKENATQDRYPRKQNAIYNRPLK